MSDLPSARLDRSAWMAAIAGLSASLVGIGLARFAYMPLIPALIQAHWFSAADVVTLSAANFAGYLAGALLGRRVALILGNRRALRLMMFLTTVTFFTSAYPLSLSWYFVWRFLSGFTGGVIMVLAATTVLPHIPPARRGFVGGMIFIGLGLGIAASGTLIPELLQYGLRATWFGLGAFAFVLTALSWFGWPDTPPPPPPLADGETSIHATRMEKQTLRLLYVQYAANALAIVPMQVLIVNYIALNLGWGATTGARYWAIYGLAAIFGPVLSGIWVDRIGAARAYCVALALQSLAIVLIILSSNIFALAISVIILGLFSPGMVTMVLGRITEILPYDHHAQRIAWGNATITFALLQVLGGYFYAWLFAKTDGDYVIIFSLATVAMLFALAVNIFSTWQQKQQPA